MQEGWAQQEVGQAQLGHAARTTRLVQIVEDLAAHPAQSVPQACEDWAATKGAYRFWDNEQVEAAAIRRAHIEKTLARCQGQELILAIQDTTDVDDSTHAATTGRGHWQGKRTKGKLPQGLKVHAVLATSQEGVPLGLLFQHVWVREEETVAEEEQVHRRHQNIEEKESGRWLLAQQAIQASFEPEQGVLTIADREADLYDLFAQPRPVGKELLIRAKHDRRLKTEPQAQAERLWERIRQTQAAVIVAFEVPRTHDPRIAQRDSNLWQSSLNMCLFEGKEPMYSHQGGTYDQYRRWSGDHPDLCRVCPLDAFLVWRSHAARQVSSQARCPD